MTPEIAAYEGAGGWNDGRLGQAYDLIVEVIKARGQFITRHPLLAAVEAYDEDGKPARQFPQPQRRDGEEPCGECRLQDGEACDICGAKA